jgi:hypothetical protein
MNKEKFLRWVFVFAVIAFGIGYRFFSPEPNFSPIGAIALFSGFLFPSFGFLVPLLILASSDFVFGFYESLPFVYAGVFVLFLLGRSILKVDLFQVGLATLGGSLSFYIVSNFGHWLVTSMYPKNFYGLIDCYLAALPFFRTSLISDLLFSGAFFGVYYYSQRIVSALSLNPRA